MSSQPHLSLSMTEKERSGLEAALENQKYALYLFKMQTQRRTIDVIIEKTIEDVILGIEKVLYER